GVGPLVVVEIQPEREQLRRQAVVPVDDGDAGVVGLVERHQLGDVRDELRLAFVVGEEALIRDARVHPERAQDRLDARWLLAGWGHDERYITSAPCVAVSRSRRSRRRGASGWPG